MSNRRPEHLGPPELFYNEDEAKKYSSNSHIISVQSDMTERAVELLAIPEERSPALILDLGCGSGLSGEVVSELGHQWIGIDISQPMLDVAQDREVDGDLILKDMGQGVPFTAGAFDGAISTLESEKQSKMLQMLAFKEDHTMFQFYPEEAGQSELITQQAVKAGFSGGLVIDFPNSSKAKKVFLVLMTGGMHVLPAGLGTESAASNTVSNVGRWSQRSGSNNGKQKPVKGSKAWIEQKKERARKQGKDVKTTTKYTGRKRRKAF